MVPAVARQMLREPLVYFVLAGCLVFAVDAALRRGDDTIRITPAVHDELERSLRARLGRTPNAPEVQTELEHWKEEQALYREGVRRGMLDDDPVVRAHVAAKLLQIAREREVLAPPTDAELRDFLERHRSTYTLPPAFDFDHVFVDRAHGDAHERAEEVLSRLRAGAPCDGLGDWFPRGHHFTGESLADVAALLGDEAAKELPGYVVGEWNVVEGPRGLHLVRVTAVDRGEPDFDKLRAALALAFDAERRDEAARAFARGVEAHYRFVETR